MEKEEMQIITCDKSAGIILIGILEAEPICSFCGTDITENNFGGIFSKPTRICCDNICCISEAVPFEDDRKIMSEIKCEVDLGERPWDEHPCFGCEYNNKIECPHTLKGMIFNIMKEWYGITGKEEQHKMAQEYSEKSLEKFIDLYGKTFRN